MYVHVCTKGNKVIKKNFTSKRTLYLQTWCTEKNISLCSFLPKMQSWNLITRKHQINPNGQMSYKVTGLYSSKVLGVCSAMWGHSKKTAIYKPGNRPLLNAGVSTLVPPYYEKWISSQCQEKCQYAEGQEKKEKYQGPEGQLRAGDHSRLMQRTILWVLDQEKDCQKEQHWDT